MCNTFLLLPWLLEISESSVQGTVCICMVLRDIHSLLVHFYGTTFSFFCIFHICLQDLLFWYFLISWEGHLKNNEGHHKTQGTRFLTMEKIYMKLEAMRVQKKEVQNVSIYFV